MKKSIRTLLPVLAMAGAVPFAVVPAAEPSAPAVGLIGIGLNVADMDASMKFYVEGLGMQPLMTNERETTIEQFLGYPATPYPPMLELIARKPVAGAATVEAAPPPTTSFKIVMSVDDAEAIHAQLRNAGFSPPPVRMNPAAGGGAFFIKDPDGYSIEIVQRPPTGSSPAQ